MDPPSPIKRDSHDSEATVRMGPTDSTETLTRPPLQRQASGDSDLKKHNRISSTPDASFRSPWAPGRNGPKPEHARKPSSNMFGRPGVPRRRTGREWSSQSSITFKPKSGHRSSKSTSKERKEFHHPLETEATSPAAIVSFDGPKDDYLPVNWSKNKKMLVCIVAVLSTGICTFASGVWSAAVVAQIVPRFHVSHIVATLGVSLFVGGQGIGSMIWAPLSEVYGRKAIVLPPVLLGAIFAISAGQSENLRTLLVLRFFQGLFSSAPITVTVGMLSDIFPPQDRVIIIALYCATLLGGPTIGPVISAAICNADHIGGWRWTLYTAGILGFVSFFLTLLFTYESNAPTLLVKKAKKLRVQSGNWALHAKHEEGITSYREMAIKYLLRPCQLLVTPIGFFMSIYAGFTFGILFGSLSTFPVVFEGYRRWGPITASTPFVALLVGILLALIFYIVRYHILRRAIKKAGPVKGRPSPESKLPPMMIGAVFFTAGIFLMAWTAAPTYPWIAPIMGAVLQGFGFFTITISSNLYLIDTFLTNAASAIAAVTLMRNLFAVAFPLMGGVMVTHLGVEWGISVFGFVALGMLPIPFIFYYFGQTIRASSKWSQEPPAPPMGMKLGDGPPSAEFMKIGQLAAMGLLQYIGFGPNGRILPGAMGPPGTMGPGAMGPPPGMDMSKFPIPPGVDLSKLPPGFGPPPGIDLSKLPPGFTPPAGIDLSKLPPGFTPPPGVDLSKMGKMGPMGPMGPGPNGPPPGIDISKIQSMIPAGVDLSKIPPSMLPPGFDPSKMPQMSQGPPQPGHPGGLMPPGAAATGNPPTPGVSRSLSFMQRMGLRRPPPAVYQPDALRSTVQIPGSRLSWNDSSSTLWGPED